MEILRNPHKIILRFKVLWELCAIHDSFLLLLSTLTDGGPLVKAASLLLRTENVSLSFADIIPIVNRSDQLSRLLSEY